ncbi:nodulation protein NodJ, partial [Rhizobium ruizarguesonis]
GSLNWIAVWRRNYLALKKAALASLLGHFAEPLIYLFGLGAGLGVMVGRVGGVSYTAFLAAGMVSTSALTLHPAESCVNRLKRCSRHRT